MTRFPYRFDLPENPGPFTRRAPLIRLWIERDSALLTPDQIRSPADAAMMLRDRFGNADREVLAAVLLNTKNHVLAIHPVYYGTLSSASIRVNEVFKAAIALGAAGIIVAHNHPSGDPTPSPEDVLVTRQIVEAGKLLDVEVLDHVILGFEKWVSLRERGLGF